MADWDTSGDGKYTVHPTKMTRSEAKENCRSRNGNLVSINSQNEMNYIDSLISNSKDYYWIGLTDVV